MPSPLDDMYARLQEQAQGGLPSTPNNGNPRGANNMPPMPMRNTNAPSDYYAQQNPAAGRYRPPTMGGNGNDPGSWNDFGGYHYNLPNAFGSYRGYSQGTPNAGTGPGLGSMMNPSQMANDYIAQLMQMFGGNMNGIRNYFNLTGPGAQPSQPAPMPMPKPGYGDPAVPTPGPNPVPMPKPTPPIPMPKPTPGTRPDNLPPPEPPVEMGPRFPNLPRRRIPRFGFGGGG